jgi:glutathione peroxidase
MLMSIYEVSINTLAGETAKLSEFAGDVLLVVNVASRCGLTPQYEGLEHLEKRFSNDGFQVLGIPSNQFGWSRAWNCR